MNTATRWAALLALAIAAPAALAQTDTLGDEFIFFVDGTNVLVPSVDAGSTVNDPLDPMSGNKVAKFNPGSWVEGGFAFNRSEGIDATANVGATYGEGDTLYFRMLSDPANAAEGGIRIMLTDATDDVGATREDVESGAVDEDYLMRLIWEIPVELHDGQWHEFALPLPPTTVAALEAARDAGDLMDGAEFWRYQGAWSTGGFGIGPDFGTSYDDPLFEEFGWDQLYRIGPFWDNGNGGGPIYMDDVYIGGPDTDTSVATEPAAPMTGTSFSSGGGGGACEANSVTWAPLDGAGGYNVYTSLEPITDVSAEGATLLQRIGVGEDNQVLHRYESPHPSVSGQSIYYAVTSLSQFGVENQDVSSSSGAISNPDLCVAPFIRELTEDQANSLFDAVDAGTITDEFFSDSHPVFDFDTDHRTVTEGASVPDDSDVSASIKIGYTDLEEWFVYGEVTDDEVVFAPEFEVNGNTYLYDSVELEIGHYDVRTVEGADILLGSPHTSMNRGDEPDYQIRLVGRQDGDGAVIGASTIVSFSLDNQDFENSTIVERTDTGWRFLTLLPMNQIQGTSDVLLPVPATNEIQFIPFTIAINDADATGQRESQIVYSVKPNVTNQWYQTPAQWEVVAIAGNGVQGTTAIEDGSENDGFALAQTTPNPAAGVTDVSFTLGAPARATVEVFNMLGQRVLTVIDRELGVGEHTVSVDTGDLAAGVYVYRLSAGSYAAARRMTVIR